MAPRQWVIGVRVSEPLRCVATSVASHPVTRRNITAEWRP